MINTNNEKQNKTNAFTPGLLVIIIIFVGIPCQGDRFGWR
jgi:hypothetical protein